MVVRTHAHRFKQQFSPELNDSFSVARLSSNEQIKIRPHHLGTNNCNFHENEKSCRDNRGEILEQNEKLM